MEGWRWYGIVCQHYLWTFCFLGLREEVLCHHTRFNFLWTPPQTTKRLKSNWNAPFSAGSRKDKYKQSTWDHRATAACEVQALRGLKGKSNLKPNFTYVTPVIYNHNDDLPVCDLGILKYEQVLQKASNNRSRTVCGDVIQRQILQLLHWKQTQCLYLVFLHNCVQYSFLFWLHCVP